MKAIVFASLLLSSFSLFAANTNFSLLNCSVKQNQPREFEKAFNLKLKFKNITNAVNDSGLDEYLKADMTITYSAGEGRINTATVLDLELGQTTGAYDYEIHLNRKILGSNFPTNLSLHPVFKNFVFNKSLVQYKGSLELNMDVNGNDITPMSTSSSGEIICTPGL